LVKRDKYSKICILMQAIFQPARVLLSLILT